MNDPLLKTSLPLLLMQINKTAAQYRADAEAKLTALLDISTTYQRAMEANKLDPNLSQQGRRNGGEGIARSALQRLAAWEEANPDKIEDRIRSAWERVLGIAAQRPPTDPAERIAYELRQREIRDELRPLDQIQRLVIYFTTTNREVIAALENAPPTLTRDDPNDTPALKPFIDPERVRMAMIERARSSDPDAAAEMQALAAVHDIYQSAVDTARNEILREFPLLKKDPLIAAAAGTQ